MIKNSITRKILLSLSFMIFIIVLLATYISYNTDKKLILDVETFFSTTTNKILENQEKSQLEYYHKNIELISQAISNSSSIYLVNLAIDELKKKVEIDMKNKDIFAIVIKDVFLDENLVIAYNDNNRVVFEDKIPDFFRNYKKIVKPIIQKKDYTITKLGEVTIFYDEAIIKQKTEKLKAELLSKSEEFNNQMQTNLTNSIYLNIILFILLFVLILGVISIMLKLFIQKPLYEINSALDRFFSYLAGKSETIKKIDINSSDEFGKMSNYLNKNIDITVKLHNSLEEEVKKKTQELNILNKSLEEKVLEELAKNREKDHLIFQQSKNAAMGEMIRNIAHQWRQPLNELGLVAQSFKFAKQRGALTNEFIDKKTQKSKKLISKMSQTIEDFRNFFDPSKGKESFNIDESIKNVVYLFSSLIHRYEIRVMYDLDIKEQIDSYKTEFEQVVLIFLNNSIDELKVKNKIDNRIIKISSKKVDNKITISFVDNARGIDKKDLEKIFEPYYSTKEEGSGIGLSISKQIICEHMQGNLSVKNVDFEIESKKHYGAKFTVELYI